MAAMRERRSSATSQIAYNSALRALRQASKWAIWEIGPQPRTPIRKSRDAFFIIVRLHIVAPGHRGAQQASGAGLLYAALTDADRRAPLSIHPNGALRLP